VTVDQRLHIAHRSSEFIGDVEMREFSTHQLETMVQGKVSDKSEIDRIITEKLNSSKEFQQRLTELPDGIYTFGHSHLQWHKRLGNKIFINPGSCGFPMDFLKGAPYTLLEISGEIISVEERRIAYDEQKCTDDLLHSSLFKHEKVWNEIIMKEFKTHRDILISFLKFTEAYADRINDPVRPYSKQTWSAAYTEWLSCQNRFN